LLCGRRGGHPCTLLSPGSNFVRVSKLLGHVINWEKCDLSCQGINPFHTSVVKGQPRLSPMAAKAERKTVWVSPKYIVYNNGILTNLDLLVLTEGDWVSFDKFFAILTELSQWRFLHFEGGWKPYLIILSKADCGSSFDKPNGDVWRMANYGRAFNTSRSDSRVLTWPHFFIRVTNPK
jgi:hypothetical protein